MNIILKEDIDTLGKKGDIVQVKRGYARNYLIPKGIAIEANSSSLKSYEEEKRLEQTRLLKTRKLADSFAEKLSKVSLTATVQVGEEDKVFGSVTNQNIADLLNEQGFEIDRKKIILAEPLKALGVYEVPVKLHPDVEAKIKVWVVRE
ncbi:50S ribosomal protein L9 [candidate division KSB1 bacterium RBG_16_48_16]|nr:MAG: 50S ribosomal protein L9 [candidate division KSB1 bacterium RBG_16_48_16]